MTRREFRRAQRQASKVTGNVREPAQEPRHGTNGRRADTESSDAGQNVQREMRGSA